MYISFFISSFFPLSTLCNLSMIVEAANECSHEEHSHTSHTSDSNNEHVHSTFTLFLCVKSELNSTNFRHCCIFLQRRLFRYRSFWMQSYYHLFVNNQLHTSRTSEKNCNAEKHSRAPQPHIGYIFLLRDVVVAVVPSPALCLETRMIAFTHWINWRRFNFKFHE